MTTQATTTSVTLSRDSNQALGIGQFAINFMNGSIGEPDEAMLNRAFGIGQLFAGSYRAPRNVMRDGHADRRFDLLGCRPKHRPVGCRRADGAMDDVIDSVGLEAKHKPQHRQ